MRFLKKHKGKILFWTFAVILLTFAFFQGEDEIKPVPQAVWEEQTEIFDTESLKNTETEPIPEITPTEPPQKVENKVKQEIQSTQQPIKEPIEIPETPEEVQEEQNTCFIEVRCDSLVINIDSVKKEKRDIVPKSGVILSLREVSFDEGDSAFDVLQEELKKNKIHLEFQGTTVYDSVYIEGIANLYEFDAGAMSGWIYKVNGITPSIGCSMYEVKNGDKIQFLYTCNMGRDL